ncbi:MAG: hypothetical protein Alpg2KO_17650 [Alphaproteobacteria bacterium]
MCSGEIAALLLEHGADGTALYRGHSAYAFARVYGNAAVAHVLEAAGQATALDEAETLLAVAAEGACEGQIDPAALSDEMKRIMTRILGFSEQPLPHVQRLAALGIDPDWTEEMGLTALHMAGWEGHAGVVEWLLGQSPDLDHVNDYGGDLLSTIIHGAEFSANRAQRDHLRCATLALQAGCQTTAREIELCGDEDMAALLQDWVEAHPDAVKPDWPET